jgi:hypothetical protein
MGFPLSPAQVSTQLVGLVFRPTRVSIGSITLDATVRELHGVNAEVTDHPVEKGAEITDYIRIIPDELEIEGVVTDTPVEIFEWAKAQTRFQKPSTRSKEAYKALRDILAERKPLELIKTRLRDYKNMAMISLRVDRDATTGNAINAIMRFREIIIANTETVEAATPADKSNESVTDRGKVSKSAASAPVTQAGNSFAERVYDSGAAQIKSFAGGLGVGG